MNNAQPPGVAGFIVAYRSPALLAKCIQSVDQQLPDIEVHVWDNSGPTCSDVRGLAGRFPHVHWYLGSENIGFAAAVNRLAETVPGDFLLLNPDAELAGPLLLTRKAIRDHRTAAAAPMMWQPSDGDDRASRRSGQRLPWDVGHRRLTVLNALSEAAIAAERLRGTPFSNLYRSQPSDIDGYLTGACLAICREAWNSLGPFDEQFFLYGEEADWQRRAIAAGWRVRLTDEIGVRHTALGTVAGDTVVSKRSWDLYRASRVLQLEYRYGVRAAEFYTAGAFLIESMKRVLHRRSGPIQKHSDVVITVDGSHSISTGERVSLAMKIANSGCAVTVVSLQPLGTLPRELPPSIRLLRRPWWWPWTWPGDSPRLLVPGETRRERAFARLFLLRRKKVCADPTVALGRLDGYPKETPPKYDLESI